MNERVVLLHGLWMRGFTMFALRRRLERAGFAVDLFDYASVWRALDASLDRLIARVQSLDAQRVHLVGHSLGGLLALRAVQREPHLPPGRVVCLGSPLRGSAVARAIARFPGGGWTIGGNLQTLLTGFERWNGERPVGVIAGCRPLGLGCVLGALPVPHDGTVSVEETRLPGIADHCLVRTSHSGLLFSAEAAAQTVAFLRRERFDRAAVA